MPVAVIGGIVAWSRTAAGPAPDGLAAHAGASRTRQGGAFEDHPTVLQLSGDLLE